MGMKYLWDSNIVIYYLKQQFPQVVEKIVDNYVNESQTAISVISEIELYSNKKALYFLILTNYKLYNWTNKLYWKVLTRWSFLA